MSQYIPGGTTELTDRECQVMELISLGHTNGEISAGLDIKMPTVRSHMINIFNKLGARNRVEAVRAYEREYKNTPVRMRRHIVAELERLQSDIERALRLLRTETK